MQDKITLSEVQAQIQDVLDVLGDGRMDSVAYDTAWLGRLSGRLDEFRPALEWLRKNQLPDGSWGGVIPHYHDRVICTLAALLALRECGNHKGDEERIRRGEAYLWHNLERLHYDASDTVGFPILAVSLSREAILAGLDVPENISTNAATIEKKLNLLGSDPSRWRYTTMSYSLEAVPPYLPDLSAFQRTDYVLDNGSIGGSPAATVSYLLHRHTLHAPALEYLRTNTRFQGDAGAGNHYPCEVFDIAWGLHPLWLAGAITPDQVRSHLDVLWGQWSHEEGISFSRYFPVNDLDDTATAFELLKWAGYPVSADTFRVYEDESYFRCFPGEANLSLSVNIRALAAMQMEPEHPQFSGWVDKIGAMLRRYDLDHRLWFDKWHASPYYLTSLAVCSLHGMVDDLLPSRIKWILRTQHADGGWGYFQTSTQEETALCLQALLYWDQNVERIEPRILESAANYLMAHFDDDHYPAMYIDKCLYMPRNIVRATILGALYNYLTH